MLGYESDQSVTSIDISEDDYIPESWDSRDDSFEELTQKQTCKYLQNLLRVVLHLQCFLDCHEYV